MKVLLLFVACVLSLSAAAAPKNLTLQQALDFLNTNYPSTPLYGGLGGCSFPVTSASNDVNLQKYMDMGVCMLHTFWPEGAMRAFNEVIKRDKTCAMAYWGLYQAFSWDSGLTQAKTQALDTARSYSSLASKREQLYISAEGSTAQVYNDTYQQIFTQYPDDINAKSLWAWYQIVDTIRYMAGPASYRTQVQNFLANLLKNNPKDVGAMHYHIHAWEDTSDPYQCIYATQNLVSISPLAGHNVHMPGHIYFLLGDHDKSSSAFRYGTTVDEWAMGNFTVNFMNYWEYVHNIAYLTANLGEGGHFAEGVERGTFLLKLNVDLNTPMLVDWNPIYSRSAARYYFQGLVALPFLYFQFSNWKAAQTSLVNVNNAIKPILNSDTNWLLSYYNALYYYANAMDAFYDPTLSQQAALAIAQAAVGNLTNLISTLAPTMNQTTENGFQVGQRSWIALNTNLQEAQGVVFALQKDWNNAFSTLRTANHTEAIIPYNEPPVYTRPVLATYADVFIRRANLTSNTSDYYSAAAAYNEVIHSPWHNNSGFGWFGIGQSYAFAKNVPQAKYAFNSFLQYWATADPSLPQVVYAKNYIQTVSDNAAPQLGGSLMFSLVVIFVSLVLL